MKSEGNRTVIGILVMVFVSFLVLMIFATYTVKMLKSESDSMGIGKLSESGPIGVIEVEGVILESKKTIELLHRAEKDPSVKAIILRINSPGGAVGPTQEIYEEVRRIDGGYRQVAKDKEGSSDEGKPIYASFGAIAASGGYYLGAATRKIYASPGTLTGSIGVIMEMPDLSRLYQFIKINPQIIKAGKFKDIGSPARPLKNEEKRLLTQLMRGVHEQFIGDILNTREKKIKGDIHQIAQGQIYSGQEAFQLGLVDEMSGLWASARKIHQEMKIEEEFGIKYIKKKKKVNFFEILENLEEAVSHIKYLANFEGAPLLMFKR